MNTNIRQKCINCKKEKCIDQFGLKANGKGKLKTCALCVEKYLSRYKCQHGRQKYSCQDCGGSSICEHRRIRNQCHDCGGIGICEHGRRRIQCQDCVGTSICEHGRHKYSCHDCGGSSICKHDRRRSKCHDCGGASICRHGRERSKCRECDFPGFLAARCRKQVRSALKRNKSKHSIEYIGCSIETLKAHLESKFTEGMTWENYGDWHIDHIVPIKYGEPTLEQVIERLHYMNLQPLWAADNISKGNRYIG